MCRLHFLSSFFATVVGNNHFDNSVIKPNGKKQSGTKLHSEKNHFYFMNTMDSKWF